MPRFNEVLINSAKLWAAAAAAGKYHVCVGAPRIQPLLGSDETVLKKKKTCQEQFQVCNKDLS